MDDRYEYLYNRALDVSAVIHISVKLFTVLVITRHTPKNHRYHSYFVLHIMFWNFVCNLMFALVHIYPLYPAECMRLDGLSGLFIESETFGHVMFLAAMTSTGQCGVALVSAFVYRYIVFGFPYFAPKPARVVLLCCGVHIILTFLLLPLGIQWIVSYDDYPLKEELPPKIPSSAPVFCFHPCGHRKIATVTSYLAFSVVCFIVGLMFSILFIMKVRSEKRAFHSQTVTLQRKLFMSLLIITAIAILFGGIPLLIIVIAAVFPHLPYARYTVMICVVILCNHGSVYSVTYLILFKAYRDAVKSIFFKLIGKEEQSNITPTVFFHIKK